MISHHQPTRLTPLRSSCEAIGSQISYVLKDGQKPDGSSSGKLAYFRSLQIQNGWVIIHTLYINIYIYITTYVYVQKQKYNIYIQTYRTCHTYIICIYIYSSIPSYISRWWVNLDPPSSKHPHVLPWPGPKDGARRPASGASGASAARQPNLAQWEQIWAAARKRSGEGAVLNEGRTVKFEKNGDEKMLDFPGVWDFTRKLDSNDFRCDQPRVAI